MTNQEIIEIINKVLKEIQDLDLININSKKLNQKKLNNVYNTLDDLKNKIRRDL